MRSLLQRETSAFLERFDNFRGAEFRSLKIINPTNIRVTFGVQDRARAFDWISISIDFYGISDAQLLDEEKLKHLDMSDGVSLLFEEGLFAFGTSECYNISSLKNSSIYLIAESIKYEEGQF